MQITSSSPNFTSRNAYIRRADDIVRKVRNEFPMFSPTLAFDNWKTIQPTNASGFKNAKKVLAKHRNIIEAYRKNNDFSSEAPHFFECFESVQKTKMGNCREAGIMTLGTLLANGHPAVKVSPTIEMHVIDKNGQDIFTCRKFCDHVMVMANMDKTTPDYCNDSIILDTWMGSAMHPDEALKVYEEKYMDLNFLPALLRTHKELIKEKGFFKGLAIILDSKTTYEPKMHFGGAKEQKFSVEQMQEWGKKIAKKFPQIVMSENNENNI